MVDKNNFFKNSLDNELKNIYVTEELKLKTLSRIKKEDNVVKPFKCKRRFSYRNMKGLALVSSILIMFFTFSFLKSNKPVDTNPSSIDSDDNGKNFVLDDKEKLKSSDNQANKDTRNVNTKEIKDEKLNKKDETSKSNNDKNVNENNNNYVNKEINNPNKSVKESKKENNEPKKKKQDPKLSEQQMLARAENLWGGKINLPSYIPKGYDVTNIDMDTAYGSKVLKITYKNPNSANFLELKVLEGDKTAFKDGNDSKNKNNDKKDDDNKKNISDDNSKKPNEDVESVNSNKNGVEYNIEGNIPAKTLEKIAESIEE